MTNQTKFSGEDENAGFTTPVQDLIAAAFLIALSLWIMFESLQMGSSGSVATAPGLLPFVTAGSLCAMAISLGLMAMRRRAQAIQIPTDDEERPDHARTAMLVGLLGAYLLCLQFVGFEYALIIGGIELGYGAFEVLTILFLTSVLAVFWGQAIWKCLAISAVWVTLLAAAFRYVFVIPLPGSV